MDLEPCEEVTASVQKGAVLPVDLGLVSDVRMPTSWRHGSYTIARLGVVQSFLIPTPRNLGSGLAGAARTEGPGGAGQALM